ncbi:diaminohydroxyphosphoribosylaminopyrimidine deaminase / 5-amino-6-(5-phosphoribosylamino)uracil reductase [Pontimonas salivibrio]|uniref:Riboflavin biosynthesis protein RibD n=1 Tax=Pontimonas salivibrio TaxID=1159327 RepID=A0A2L2BSG5_9MICO|nr:bifunctional diaminohydroxyphosphoribosylaminopyrimidine deaminase/5-amino-6-(5-phosphoribosylamino)uracil reductase RibD [Pontimonas salivibrio]AVG24615.1 diaminohydroxyphosphoribosylaminopyrimidine deaminase / 5-amino-6-(5-phosphoribosylamino)uracil reductase [Pontimonas salivibrio]
MNNTAQDQNTLEAMARALSLAARSPEVGRNPRVGCVLTDDSGNIVAEGYHLGAGHPHAEVEALGDARAKGVDTRGLTAVVTLEPCNHHGTTGPCSLALQEAGIARVVFGASDPGDHSGGGHATLSAAGIEVVPGVMAQQSEDLNTHWFFAMRQQRPFVTAKWAQSLDGRSAAPDQTSQWITGTESRHRVHEQRAQHGVIMVGTTTALVDNPSLTARTPEGGLASTQPHAVVMGHREIPETSAVRNHPGGFQQMSTHEPQRALEELFTQGFRSVYLEGGKTLMSAFVQADLVDEHHITMGPMLLGGKYLAVDDIGVETMSDAKALTISSVETLGSDIWVVATPTRAEEE